MELISKNILFFLLDSEVLTKTLSNTLSLKYKRRPPIKNPIVVISQGFKLRLSAPLIAGASKEKYEADIITPAAKANIASNKVLFTFLKKKTIDAPALVIKNVNNVAIKACHGALKFKKTLIIFTQSMICKIYILDWALWYKCFLL